MAKSRWIEMHGFLAWAKVFEENYDDSEFHEETDGAYICNFYPSTEAEKQKYIDAGGPMSAMGHDTFKKDGDDYGIGEYMKCVRKRVNERFPSYGGAPMVFDFREGPSTKLWSYEDDGELGNGTEVSVKMSLYGNKPGDPRTIKRLEKIAVIDLVEYTPGENIDPDAPPSF